MHLLPYPVNSFRVPKKLVKYAYYLQLDADVFAEIYTSFQNSFSLEHLKGAISETTEIVCIPQMILMIFK